MKYTYLLPSSQGGGLKFSQQFCNIQLVIFAAYLVIVVRSVETACSVSCWHTFSERFPSIWQFIHSCTNHHRD